MRAAAPSIWNTQMAEVKKDYGNLVHTAFAKVKTIDDIVPAINAMCGEGMITIPEKEALKLTLTKIVTLPELKTYFAPGQIIKNEAEIISVAGEFFRPDRVVLSGKTAVIIDYKTGGEKQDHKKQIIGYSDLLTQLGYSVSKRLLVYIEDEKVVSV